MQLLLLIVVVVVSVADDDVSVTASGLLPTDVGREVFSGNSSQLIPKTAQTSHFARR